MSVAFVALFVLALATPAHAFDLKEGIKGKYGFRVGDGGVKMTVGTDAEIQARATKELDKRINDLQELSTRLGEMKRLSASSKATLQATITAEISSLNTLKTKISTETGAALKEDAASITGSYRVYMVVMPQIRIMAASERELAVADMLTTLSGKLDAKVAVEKAAGKDVASLETNLTDMKAKIASAKADAQAAATLVAGLTPDQKDQAKFEANQKAFADARAKIKSAHASIKSAYASAKIVIKAVDGNSKDDKKGEGRHDADDDR